MYQLSFEQLLLPRSVLLFTISVLCYCIHEFFLIQNNSVRYLPGFGPTVSQVCGDCGKKFNMGGPIWSAPIHDQEWVSSILSDVKSMKDTYPAYDRISAILTTISEVCFPFKLFIFPFRIELFVVFWDYVSRSSENQRSSSILAFSFYTVCRNCLMFLCS